MAIDSSKRDNIDWKLFYVWKIVILTFGENFKYLRLSVFELK